MRDRDSAQDHLIVLRCRSFILASLLQQAGYDEQQPSSIAP